MGFLKKITRPISRVLDKIVPNEIKPALPFLAAAAPFMAPGIMGIGGNTMLSRALISGGLNLGGQLAQEGSEGDFNALSLALASGIGALSAPNAGAKIRGIDPNFVGPQPAAEGIVGQGREFLAKSADFLGPQTGGVTDILGKGGTKAGFDMATAKAASIPLTQGTMDLGFAEARRAANDVVDDALAGIGEGASDADRALAIRNAMEAYGYFSEDEILSTIESAGYRAGGRVGLKGGGMDAREMNISEPGIMGNPAVMEKIENMREFMIANPDIEDITDYSEKYESKDPDFEGIKGAVESVDENLRVDRAGDFFRLREEAIQKGDSDKIKEIESDFFREFGMVMPKMAKDGGLMNLGGKEMDLRKGGFVPIGKKERADDVPARLSKNEFVMTADAVRAAGGGSVNEGAKRMYDVMNKLEARA